MTATMAHCRFCNRLMYPHELTACEARGLFPAEQLPCEPDVSPQATAMSKRIAAGIEKRQKLGRAKPRK